jgi:molybdenum cofactor cytidylyltransferase
MNYLTINVVILAAGLSQRMGETNKLLITVDDEPMIRRTVKLYQAAGLTNIIVVVGYQQEKIRAALTGLNINIVNNNDFNEGQVSSIRCGVKALSNDCEYAFIALSDQPLLSVDDITFLINSFKTESNKTIQVPYFKGDRGNPLLLRATQLKEVDNQGVHLGCRKLIDKHPEKVQRVEVHNNHFTCDLDTPEDVKAVLGKVLR